MKVNRACKGRRIAFNPRNRDNALGSSVNLPGDLESG